MQLLRNLMGTGLAEFFINEMTKSLIFSMFLEFRNFRLLHPSIGLMHLGCERRLRSGKH